jgi:hypothetical protein
MQLPSLGTYCWEMSGYFPEEEVSEEIEEGRAFCLIDIEDVIEQAAEDHPGVTVSGSATEEKCQATDFVCSYNYYGEELKVYLSGLLADTWDGECPSTWRGLFLGAL